MAVRSFEVVRMIYESDEPLPIGSSLDGLRSTTSAGATLRVGGVEFVADLSGALFWEEQSLLVVSDLHLEKGSSFAMRGVLLPPYDTVATLGRLAAVDRAARSAYGDRARRQFSRPHRP